MRPKQAQSDSMKTIDSQLPRNEQKGTEYLEALLRKDLGFSMVCSCFSLFPPVILLGQP